MPCLLLMLALIRKLRPMFSIHSCVRTTVLLPWVASQRGLCSKMIPHKTSWQLNPLSMSFRDLGGIDLQDGTNEVAVEYHRE
eukprot:1555620-Amphidinium_carterae.1